MTTELNDAEVAYAAALVRQGLAPAIKRLSTEYGIDWTVEQTGGHVYVIEVMLTRYRYLWLTEDDGWQMSRYDHRIHEDEGTPIVVNGRDLDHVVGKIREELRRAR